MRCNAPAYEGIKPYIFVSYSHDDEMRVYPYIEMLARKGARIWYDEGITPGDEWPEVIAQHLERCDVFVAIITESSVTSHNCRREINYAISLNKEIICLYVDDVPLSSALSMLLANTQAVKKSRYSQSGDFMDKVLQNEAVRECCGEARTDIEVFDRIDDGDMTLTMTQADFVPKALQFESVLIRVRTMEEIRIDKSLFSVGRSEEHSDYALKGDPSISRRHMTIKKAGGKFYVIDNESLNHVLLNGRLIAPGREYEIYSYDVLFLAHEAMVFIDNYNADYMPVRPHVLHSDVGDFEIGRHSVVRIGSRMSNSPETGREICLSAAGIDSDHCFIINTPEGLYVTALSLTETTQVNGSSVPIGQKTPIRPGDEIRVGQMMMTLRR